MKLIFRLTVAVGAVLVLVVTAGVFWLDTIVASYVQRHAARATGVAAHVAAVDTRPLAGELAMRGFALANPPGFTHDRALALEHATLELEAASLFRKQVVVRRLELRGVRVALERGADGRTNCERILAHLLEQARTDRADGARRYRVDELLLTGIEVVVDNPLPFGSSAPIILRLPDIHLRDIGGNGDGVDGGGGGDGGVGSGDGDDGVLMTELCGLVLDAVMEAVVAETTRELPGRIIGELLSRGGYGPRDPAGRLAPASIVPARGSAGE